MSTAIEKRTDTEVQRAEPTSERPWFQPSVNIYETPEELVVTANMPGTCADDIDVEFDNGVLTIHGKVKDRQPEGVQYLLREYAVGDFHRTFEVSERIDREKISAEYAGGVLTLHLPKVEEARPRKITVAAR